MSRTYAKVSVDVYVEEMMCACGAKTTMEPGGFQRTGLNAAPADGVPPGAFMATGWRVPDGWERLDILDHWDGQWLCPKCSPIIKEQVRALLLAIHVEHA